MLGQFLLTAALFFIMLLLIWRLRGNAQRATPDETHAALARQSAFLQKNHFALALTGGGALIALIGSAMVAGVGGNVVDVAIEQVDLLDRATTDFVRLRGTARPDLAMRGGNDRVWTPLTSGDAEIGILLVGAAPLTGNGPFVGLPVHDRPPTAQAPGGIPISSQVLVVNTELTPEERKSAGPFVALGGAVLLIAGLVLLRRQPMSSPSK